MSWHSLNQRMFVSVLRLDLLGALLTLVVEATLLLTLISRPFNLLVAPVTFEPSWHTITVLLAFELLQVFSKALFTREIYNTFNRLEIVFIVGPFLDIAEGDAGQESQEIHDGLLLFILEELLEILDWLP